MDGSKVVDKVPGMREGSTSRNVVLGIVYVVFGLLIISAALGGPNLLDSWEDFTGTDAPNVSTDTPVDVVDPTPTTTENSTDTATATVAEALVSPAGRPLG